jgi:uncharacterized membrane protein YfcA
MSYLLYVTLGLFVGVIGGFFGICGAVMVPALVYVLGFTQHEAQGTALAVMVLPIGLLAAWRYWLAGHIKIPIVACICLGWLIGGLVGAQFAQNVPDPLLRRLFGSILLVISLRMIFFK